MAIKLRQAASGTWQEIEFVEGMRICDLFQRLNYHPASIALIFLNGKPADLDAQLKDRDEIIIVPSIGGG